MQKNELSLLISDWRESNSQTRDTEIWYRLYPQVLKLSKIVWGKFYRSYGNPDDIIETIATDTLIGLKYWKIQPPFNNYLYTCIKNAFYHALVLRKKIETTDELPPDTSFTQSFGDTEYILYLLDEYIDWITNEQIGSKWSSPKDLQRKDFAEKLYDLIYFTPNITYTECREWMSTPFGFGSRWTSSWFTEFRKFIQLKGYKIYN